MSDQPAEHKSPPGWTNPPLLSLEVVPTYCNVFAIVSTPEIVRIAFGEGFNIGTASGTGSPTLFHSAVAMTMNDARQLVQTLSGIVGVRVTPIEGPSGG